MVRNNWLLCVCNSAFAPPSWGIRHTHATVHGCNIRHLPDRHHIPPCPTFWLRVSVGVYDGGSSDSVAGVPRTEPAAAAAAAGPALDLDDPLARPEAAGDATGSSTVSGGGWRLRREPWWAAAAASASLRLRLDDFCGSGGRARRCMGTRLGVRKGGSSNRRLPRS